eukprot:GEMP01054354.1.p2 GENE.GEMP01054354.1~~GEMP01054354.1.p2  ORF type:complete len:113 (-),score=18.27 GEMP01054354.1:577-915(-)
MCNAACERRARQGIWAADVKKSLPRHVFHGVFENTDYIRQHNAAANFILPKICLRTASELLRDKLEEGRVRVWICNAPWAWLIRWRGAVDEGNPKNHVAHTQETPPWVCLIR